MTHPICYWAALIVGMFAVERSQGGPPSREEGERREKITEDANRARTPALRIAMLDKSFHAEPSPDVRRVVFGLLPKQPDATLDAFLTGVLKDDPDAGIRSLAAKALGTYGTDQCLPALAKAVSSDKETEFVMGCMVGKATARRDATFAIAELAARFPKLSDKAVAELKDLKIPAGPKDNTSLADARTQALYQITRDEKLLKPFLEQLQSQDAKVRERGAVAFRFFKLKAAPTELVAALDDADAGVRSWAALTVGEIGDPKTIPLLTALAGDTKKDVGERCNGIHALGRMKVVAATALMRTLLTDESESVQIQAAIALYRIAGEKVKQFPAGYNAD